MDINDKFLGFNVFGGDPLGDLIDQLMQYQAPTYGSNSIPDEYYQNYLRNQGYMPDDVTRLLGQKQALDAQNFETETRAFQNERDRIAQLTAERVKLDQDERQFKSEQERLTASDAARIGDSEKERSDRLDAMKAELLFNRLPENMPLPDLIAATNLIMDSIKNKQPQVAEGPLYRGLQLKGVKDPSRVADELRIEAAQQQIDGLKKGLDVEISKIRKSGSKLEDFQRLAVQMEMNPEFSKLTPEAQDQAFRYIESQAFAKETPYGAPLKKGEAPPNLFEVLIRALKGGSDFEAEEKMKELQLLREAVGR